MGSMKEQNDYGTISVSPLMEYKFVNDFLPGGACLWAGWQELAAAIGTGTLDALVILNK